MVVAAGFLVFGALDGLYLSSALTKVPEGAWFTLALAIILSSVFILWRFGKENQWRAEASDRIPPSHILAPYETAADTKLASEGRISEHQGLRLTPAFGGADISPIKGMGIFFDKTGNPNSTPTVFIHFLQKFQAAPTVVVFFHIRPLSNPTVPPEERFTVTRSLNSIASSASHSFFRITLRHGYTDEAITRDLGMLLYEQLRNFVIQEQNFHTPPPPISEYQSKEQSTSSSASALPTDQPIQPNLSSSELQQALVRTRLAALESAYADQVVYVVGKEQMRVREDHGIKGWSRRIALLAFLWIRGNTGSKVANLNVDVEKLVEVGFVKVV